MKKTAKLLILSVVCMLVLSVPILAITSYASDDGAEATPYGDVPANYADENVYPFVIFDTNGKFIAAYEKLYGPNGGNQSALNKLTYTHFTNKTYSSENGWAEGVTELVLYMRRNYTLDSDETYTNLSHIQGNLIFDLGGHTINHTTTSWRPLFRANAKGSSGTLGEKEYPTLITVKNGSIKTCGAPLVEVSSYNSTGNVDKKKFEFTFDNITFGLAPGSNLAHYMLCFQNPYSTSYGHKTATVDLIFNECTYDLVTNYNNKCNEIFRNTPAETQYVKCNVTVNGGNIITSTPNLKLYTVNTDVSGSSVVFGKTTGGNYTSIKVVGSAAKPSFVALNADGGTLSFVKISEDDEGALYRLRPTELANISFVPKMSVTLASDFIANIYVPKEDYLLSLELDGVSQSLEALELKNIDGKDYYLIKVPLVASEAARDVVLKAGISLAQKNASATFSFSIPKYAEKLLDSDSMNVEKTLISDALSYIKYAYIYFDADDKDEAIAKIEKVIGDHVGSLVVEGSGAEPTEGLLAASFVLGATPAVRFYIPDGASADEYGFYVDGTKVKDISVGCDDNGAYIDVKLYAYKMCEEITYSIGGEEIGSYHINSYYEFAKTKNDKSLVDVVRSFWIYCQSARRYKAAFSVVNGEFNPVATVVNKNGADATVSYVIDDGAWGTATFVKEMMGIYDNLKVSYAVPAKQFATLVTEDSDGDGIPEYVMVDGKYVYEVNENGFKFWNDVLVEGKCEIVSHTFSHAFWGTNDDGGSFEYMKNGESSPTVSEVMPEGSSTKEIYASKQIIEELFGDYVYKNELLSLVDAGISVKTVNHTLADGTVVVSYRIFFKELLVLAYERGDLISVRGTFGWNYDPSLDISSKVVTAQRYDTYDERMSTPAYMVEYYNSNPDGDGSDDVSNWIAYIDSAIELNGWACFCIHMIDDNAESGHYIYQSQAEKMFAYTNSKNVWVATYTEAAMYYSEWSTANIEVAYENGAISVTLTDGERDDVYTEELTVKVSVPEEWQSAKCGSELLTVHRDENGGAYVYVNIVPDSGTVYVTGFSAS